MQLEKATLESHIRTEIAKLDPGIGFSEPQTLAVIEIVKKILDTR
ncbi:MAG TPA: hypothetical protein VHY35_06245 [Stellaceae bacterium]|jgi:hypothetical protein|nr:hypothetical protein [Stellaceae bacterium]